MDLTLTADQEATRDLARRIFEREVSPASIRAAEPLGHDPALWSRLVEAGIPAMAGDTGVGLPLLTVVAEEAGRSMAPVPLVEHHVACRLAGEETGVAGEGPGIAAFGPVPASGGIARLVPGGAVADAVVALDGDEVVVAASPPPMAAVPNHACAPLADRSVRSSARRVVFSGPAASQAFERARDEWRVLTAAALAGLAAAALDLAVAYVKERHQFGVPIGSFQAVQHGLADLPGAITGAQLLVQEAAWALESGTAAATGAAGPELASMAFLHAAETARDATARCVQYHGGYGVAEEYAAQLMYRRARGWPLAIGDPAGELARLGGLLVEA